MTNSEPPMPVMTLSDDCCFAGRELATTPRRATEDISLSPKIPESSLLFMTPPPPQTLVQSPGTTNSSSGVNDLFDALSHGYGTWVSPLSAVTTVTSGSPSGGVVFPGALSSNIGQIETIVLVKSNGPLGFSIVGGVDHSCHPFGHDKPGLFISKIVPHGAASRTRLKFGDRLLKVNNKDVRQMTHMEAVRCLTAPGREVILEVQHEPSLPGLQEVEITKRPGEKLGISIRGGTKSKSGNPLDKNDEGIFISKVMPVGAVARNGRLRVGQRILEVSGESLLGLTHQEAVCILRSVTNRFTVVVCDGFDSSLLDAIDDSDAVPSLRAAGSLSSIDCDTEEYARKEAARNTISNSASSPRPSSFSTSYSFELPSSVSAVTHQLPYGLSSILTPSSGMSSASSPISDSEFLSPGSQSRSVSRPPVAPKSWKAQQSIGSADCQPIEHTSLLLNFTADHRCPSQALNQPNGTGSQSLLFDPVRHSKIPSARPTSSPFDVQSPKAGATPTDREILAFNMKKKFFEKEIENMQPRLSSLDYGSHVAVPGQKVLVDDRTGADTRGHLSSSAATPQTAEVHLTVKGITSS
jgi:protein scribble